MPPRKLTTRGASQKSLASAPVAPSSYERKPHPPTAPPDAASVAPLWTPPSKPKQLFPEWSAAAVLATENWGSDEALYEDPTPFPTEFFCSSSSAREIEWKRPSQFLPAIVESSQQSSAASLAPVVPDAKHGAAKKAAPAPTKKNEPEPPKKPKAPKFAHIVYVPLDHANTHHAGSLQPPQQAQVAPAIDPKKNPALAAAASHPSTPTTAVSWSTLQPPPRRILRDFRRLWSAEQEKELTLWQQEEDRMEREREHRERVYLEFEDATAFIINDRPRQLLHDENVNAEDLEDDGEDDDEDLDSTTASVDSSPYGGMLPPPRMEIATNAIIKPEIPHGKVVHADFASYIRIVDQLYQQRAGEAADQVPYLWEAIYPQDAQGVPVYNPAGKYSVKLFVAGKWRRVDVDDKLPVDQDEHIQILSSAMKSEIWPTILAKALLKVVMWLGTAGEVVEDRAIEAIRATSVVITALTGWKVTRHEAAAFAGGNYQSLQKYIPESHSSDAQNELILDGAEEEPSGPVQVPGATVVEEKVAETAKPRAIICSTGDKELPGLVFREASLLVDIVGDAGSLTLKAVDLNGATSFAEEVLTPDVVTFLIVHPPFRHSDLISETWSVNHEGVEAPYTNPVTQFCVVKGMKKQEKSGSEDLSLAASAQEDDMVDVVVTLTRTPPLSCSSSDAAVELANHLHVDPLGSVILVEDLELEAYRRRVCGASPTQDQHQQRRPLVFKIDTSSSALLRLPRGEYASIAFRVYPQSSCRYGYNLQVESGAKVDWQIASLNWRNVWDLQVVEGDGVYPVLSPGSWNILFKQSIELAPPADERAPPPELHMDLHLSDPDLAPSVHVYLVRNEVDDPAIPLPGLHTRTTLPLDASNYTLVVECCPKVVVPTGHWHLSLGSNRVFKHATILQPRMTVFEGVYAPNKPLVCLRDVVALPKKTTSTSVQFQLLQRDSVTDDTLAAKIEIVDLATGERLKDATGNGIIRVLQLPPYSKAAADPNEEKSGYIIQGSIDKTKCHVPDWARSVRPFNYRNSVPEAPTETPIEEDPRPPTATAEHDPRDHKLKWRLTCWSTEDVKLEFDRTQEIRFDAIRATWAEAAKDRDAHGVSSRLLFLGKTEAAQTAMAEDGLADELVAKYTSRLDWLRLATQQVAGVAAADHILILPEQDPTQEVLKTAEHFTRDEEQLQTKLDEAQALLQAIRDERTAAKESRAGKLEEFVQSCKDQRKHAEKERRDLYAQRDHVLATSGHAA